MPFFSLEGAGGCIGTDALTLIKALEVTFHRKSSLASGRRGGGPGLGPVAVPKEEWALSANPGLAF